MTDDEKKRVLEIVEELNEMYLEVRSIKCREEGLNIKIHRLEQELNRLKGSHR